MFTHPLRTFFVTLISISFALQLANAQTTAWTITGPAFETSATDLQAAAAKITAEPFMSTTVFFERDHFVFDKDGRMTYTHDVIYRIETQEGVENWSETRRGWSPWYQNPPEIKVRVITPEGKVVWLDQNTITDGPAREDSLDTYTDARIRKAPLPAMTVGAIVEEETVSTDKQPFFAAGRGLGNAFNWPVPLHHGQLKIEIPASMQFRIKVLNQPDAVIKNEVIGDTRHYTLEQGYIPASVSSDITLPTHNFLGHGTQFSTGESWTSVTKAYITLAEPNIDPAKVKGLLPKPGANRNETISRIVAALHKNVRYTGIEFGEASLQPTPATEVLKRHYGDCKDKAALLVAMLRAAGFEANMALLNTGPGVDTDPDLPGMSFNHAIVYLPATKDDAALWIDATAEYFQVGTLPSMDEDRQALIIADGTTGLTMTPKAKPEDDFLIEQRDVELADNGPAKITETSITHGEVDASYRSLYGNELTREQKEGLEKYAKNMYQAKSLVSVTHADTRDLSKPFALKLEMSQAKRGDSGFDDAVMNIPPGPIFYRLREWFRTDPETEGVKLTPQQEENRKLAQAARTSEYDVHPFATEWHYSIKPPEGFVVRALPENKSTNMGPALFTESFEAGSDGSVIAKLRFETSKPRYTKEEVLALREAVLAAYKQDSITIWFDQIGSKLKAAGKIREAIAADQALIAKSPAKSILHAQTAILYLKAGLGNKARKQAEEAVRLDARSAVNLRTLGIICEYNDLAVLMGVGTDWTCSTNNLKKAIELDPDDSSNVTELAIINEYNREGEHYAANAPLADAIAGLRALKLKDKSEGEKYEDYILYDLLYSGKYQELLDELDKLSSTSTHRSLIITATVALQGGDKGVNAGLERANRLLANAGERSSALKTAGNMLLRLRLYPESASILAAAVEGQQDSASTAEDIAITRSLTRWNNDYLPATDPRSVVQRYYMYTNIGSFDETTAKEVWSRHSYSSDEEWNRNVKRVMQTRGSLHVRSSRTGLPNVVLLDISAGTLKLKSEGDDDSGYKVTLDTLGSKSVNYFVTREEGVYRTVAADTSKPSLTGNQVLYLLKVGRMKEAHALLDWLRGYTHKGGGDDPLSGPLLPRFWTVGDPADPAAMRWAALALISDNLGIKEVLPELRSAWEAAPAGDAKLNYALLLAHAYRTTEDGTHLKEIADNILKSYPDSYTALGFAGSADEFLKAWDEWSKLIEAQISKHPDDESLLRMKTDYEAAHGDWAAYRATLKLLMDQSKATANDYNDYGWSALFDSSINEDAIKQARHAASLNNNSNFSDLHTLACLYAAHDMTAEARDLITKSMSSFNLGVPNDSIWLALGLLYEQYGVRDEAISAYQKVEKPEGHIRPNSAYVLAQAHLKAIK